MAAKAMSFEESMDKLSKIVAQLEKGETSLEESLKLFEEGTILVGQCYKKLEKAEQKIRNVSEKESLGGEE